MLHKIPATNEDETHDGLTGLAMSLVNQTKDAMSLVNQTKDIVIAFLQSGNIHPRIVFLASEFCRLPSLENEELQSSIRTFLSSRQIETGFSRDISVEEKDDISCYSAVGLGYIMLGVGYNNTIVTVSNLS